MLKKWISSTFIGNRAKLYLKYLKSNDSQYFEKIDKSKRKVIIALAADYSNLGDVAITYAQEKFLKDLYPNAEIIDFPFSHTYSNLKALKKLCNKGDIITIVGGGNNGDLYDSAEYARQLIIKKFPYNKIISFPQTIDFSNSKRGKLALKIAKKTYNKHTNLILIAREERTYEKYKEYFPENKILHFPDIVLYLDESEPNYERNGITLTFRSDKERNINNSEKEKLVKKITSNYNNVQFYDTDIKRDLLSLQDRNSELKKIWKIYKKSKVVVTDRLHGMIFCAITKTPCIAINNTNAKVSRVYKKWLTNYSFIKMVEKEADVELIFNWIEELYEFPLEKTKTSNLSTEFNELKLFIKKSK